MERAERRSSAGGQSLRLDEERAAHRAGTRLQGSRDIRFGFLVFYPVRNFNYERRGQMFRPIRARELERHTFTTDGQSLQPCLNVRWGTQFLNSISGARRSCLLLRRLYRHFSAE